MTTPNKGEFDECGCPSHVNQDGVRTVNPNCEHLRVWLEPVADGFRCSNCGKTFLAVPSDVLEELMGVFLTIQNHTTEPPTERLASDAMRRIDEVLGK